MLDAQVCSFLPGWFMQKPGECWKQPWGTGVALWQASPRTWCRDLHRVWARFKLYSYPVYRFGVHALMHNLSSFPSSVCNKMTSRGTKLSSGLCWKLMTHLSGPKLGWNKGRVTSVLWRPWQELLEAFWEGVGGEPTWHPCTALMAAETTFC